MVNVFMLSKNSIELQKKFGVKNEVYALMPPLRY